MAGAVSLYKLEYPSGGPNIPQILNDLTVACGAGNFNWNYQDTPPHVFAVEYPSNVSQGLIDQILNGHSPQPTSAPTLIMGGGTSSLAASGVITNQDDTSLRNALASTTDGTPLIDQNWGDITVDTSTSPATITGSGARIVWPPVEVVAGVFAVWFAAQNGTVTKYVTIAGVDVSGAGAVTQDQNGQTFISQSAADTISAAKWLTSDGLFTSGIVRSFNDGGTTPDRYGTTQVIAQSETGGTGHALLSLYASKGNASVGGALDSIHITSNPADLYYPLQYDDHFGNFGIVHHGDYAGRSGYNSSTAETAIYSRTISGGSTGLEGTTFTIVTGYAVNSTGSNKTAQIRGRIGGLAGALVFDAGSVTLANGQFYPFILILWHVNEGATNAPTFLSWFSGRVFGGGAAVGAATVSGNTMSGNSTDFSSDQELVVTCQLSASASTLSCKATGAYMLGPYYAS
jgi:hypothetical protein